MKEKIFVILNNMLKTIINFFKIKGQEAPLTKWEQFIVEIIQGKYRVIDFSSNKSFITVSILDEIVNIWVSEEDLFKNLYGTILMDNSYASKFFTGIKNEKLKQDFAYFVKYNRKLNELPKSVQILVNDHNLFKNHNVK
jgi:hypothetical protein